MPGGRKLFLEHKKTGGDSQKRSETSSGGKTQTEDVRSPLASTATNNVAIFCPVFSQIYLLIRTGRRGMKHMKHQVALVARPKLMLEAQ